MGIFLNFYLTLTQARNQIFLRSGEILSEKGTILVGKLKKSPYYSHKSSCDLSHQIFSYLWIFSWLKYAKCSLSIVF